MKHHKLRIAWSVAWGVVAVLLCVLWVRSYTQADGYIWSRTKTDNEDLVMCGAGRVILMHNSDRPEIDGFDHFTIVFKTSRDMRSWFYLSTPVCDPQQHPIYYPAGFGLSRISPQGFVITFPFWFAVCTSAVVASAPWLAYRFSLRTLLIATTLVAVALGLAMYWRDK